jgi:hypothetical protein
LTAKFNVDGIPTTVSNVIKVKRRARGWCNRVEDVDGKAETGMERNARLMKVGGGRESRELREEAKAQTQREAIVLGIICVDDVS